VIRCKGGEERSGAVREEVEDLVINEKAVEFFGDRGIRLFVGPGEVRAMRS